MVDELENAHHGRQQDALSQDQLLADLGQSIIDREQALADREATGIAQARAVGVGAARDHDNLAQKTRLRHKAIELGDVQRRHQSRQAQLDQTQKAVEDHQDLLDTQQAALDVGASADATADDLERRAYAAQERAEAAARRAEAAIERARLFAEYRKPER